MEDMKSVFDAADALVAAFSTHDRDAYFAAFSPDATFIFHSLDRVLTSRAEYEKEWALWEKRDGFHVKACRSSERMVQMSGHVAVFTHKVETEVTLSGEPVFSVERETIIFERVAGGAWRAIHEHLSALP